MKLLLDECTPKRLKLDFAPHQVFTVVEVGLNGVKNGELLRAAMGHGMDVLITVDRKMPFQQNLANLQMAVLVLVAHPCRYPELKLLVPKAMESIQTIKAGDVIEVQ
jgi:predicted nuclease of predicted toxin-antitoxin system